MPAVSEQSPPLVEPPVVRSEGVARGGPSFIQRTPGVCGGVARVRDTRIAVHSLIALQRQGASEAELVDNFPALSPSDLDAVWTYYRCHAAEVDSTISAETADADDRAAPR